MPKFFPPSDGVSLSEAECDRAWKVVKLFEETKGDFDLIAEAVGFDLWILPAKMWPDQKGLFLRDTNYDGYACLLPKNTKLGMTLTLAHEIHHYYFGKPVVSLSMGRTDKNKSEGKAGIFASIIAMPYLPEGFDGALLEQHIYQRFGPRFEVYARLRINHFHKHGW